MKAAPLAAEDRCDMCGETRGPGSSPNSAPHTARDPRKQTSLSDLPAPTWETWVTVVTVRDLWNDDLCKERVVERCGHPWREHQCVRGTRGKEERPTDVLILRGRSTPKPGPGSPAGPWTLYPSPRGTLSRFAPWRPG